MTNPSQFSWSSHAHSQTLDIDRGDLTHAAEARAFVQRLAAGLGFDETSQGEAAIVATECATNLAKHGGGGELHLRAINGEIEIVAVDRGPGMPDIERCVADGYSTAGSPGTGLGAITRLSSLFDIHSVPGRGTAVLARMRRRGAAPANDAFVSGGVWRAAHGETACGDAVAVTVSGATAWALVVDGLGHGEAAAHAAAAAVNAFRAGTEPTAAGRLERVHAALRATRGAAVAVVRVDGLASQVEYSGIGNIAASIRRESGSTGLVSMPGIAGHQVRKIQPFTYAWTADSLLIAHSDGLKSQWTLDGEPGLAQRHPSIVAAVLAREFSRGRDDVSVVVVRQVRS